MRTRALAALSTLLASSALFGCGSYGNQIDYEPSTPLAPPPQGVAGAATESPIELMDPVAVGSDGSSAAGSDNSASSGGSDEPSPTPPPVCDAPTKVLVASCGNGSCHSNSGVAFGDFAVDTERAYNFVDKPSVRHPECGRIIDSSDYGKSLLLTKVRGTFPMGDCGGPMPVGSFKITEEQIDCLASWLQQFQH